MAYAFKVAPAPSYGEPRPVPLLLRLLVVVALLAPAPPVLAQAVAQAVAQHLFFEAVSTAVPTDTSYEARRRLTERVRDDVVPSVLRAAGVNEAQAVTELRMGGYRLQTNPSLHMTVPLTDEQADRLAATLGRVLDQDSVLVADFSSSDRTGADRATGYALVRFPAGTLTPDLAQRFFLAAAAEHEGLGGGYTAFGDALLFLNLRGEDGLPSSGLPDPGFAAALGRAAERFPGAALTETGRADARLIAPLPPAAHPALESLRARHAALMSETLTPEPAQ